MPERSGNTYGFIGLGLIGGSIAKAIRRCHPDARIIACNPSRSSLDEALADGVADAAAASPDERFADCDVIFLCAPVRCNEENVAAILPYLSPDAILTDIGSVKTDIHRAVRDAGLEKQFIGGHPMTGSERTKYRNSRAELLENAYYILTPEPAVPEEKRRLLRELVQSLGALPLVLPEELHDYATAAVSHLPHIVSAALVNLVRDADTPDGIMKMIAAGGFKDITRISSSSPVMWQQICLSNRDSILPLLDRYIAELAQARENIADRDDDALFRLFDGAREYRDSFFGSCSGPIMQSFALHISIPDRPHAIAEVTGLIAEKDINIKNLGIVHSREYQEGVLTLEFHTREGMEQAKELLSGQNFRFTA
ncbi:prephenate dehydrogenase [Lachnoclostridium sp. Marseille-P6806]|uniref:prephenate dehydrogenase n=1 Tax=Lachnoclostridium sp. Marseille-P6806 TaxID=2364793 RepID=UPI0010315C4E|nr:prephenate dehydrogenase [Lachnoclostridium sp. Marseille-P6806]